MSRILSPSCRHTAGGGQETFCHYLFVNSLIRIFNRYSLCSLCRHSVLSGTKDQYPNTKHLWPIFSSLPWHVPLNHVQSASYQSAVFLLCPIQITTYTVCPFLMMLVLVCCNKLKLCLGSYCHYNLQWRVNNKEIERGFRGLECSYLCLLDIVPHFRSGLMLI